MSARRKIENDAPVVTSYTSGGFTITKGNLSHVMECISAMAMNVRANGGRTNWHTERERDIFAHRHLL